MVPSAFFDSRVPEDGCVALPGLQWLAITCFAAGACRETFLIRPQLAEKFASIIPRRVHPWSE